MQQWYSDMMLCEALGYEWYDWARCNDELRLEQNVQLANEWLQEEGHMDKQVLACRENDDGDLDWLCNFEVPVQCTDTLR